MPGDVILKADPLGRQDGVVGRCHPSVTLPPSRQPHWAELEGLLARSEGNGLRSFDADQIEAFARAYRQTVCDLAIAQRDFPDDQLTLWLNGLASRAHLRLYRAPAPSWRRLGQFFWTDFARRFRAARPYLMVSALLLFGPALLAYLAALLDPTLRDALVPARLRQVMESGTTWTDMQPGGAARDGDAHLHQQHSGLVSGLRRLACCSGWERSTCS